MHYTKRGKIRNCIIHYDDILELAHFFERLSIDQGGVCSFCADFRNEASITDDDAKVFDNANFKRMDTTRLKFKYVNTNNANIIELDLEEEIAFPSYTNSYSIISNDETWLNDTYVKLTEIIDGMPKHSLFRRALSFPWVFLIYLAVQACIWKIMPLLGFSFGERPMLANGTVDPNCFFISAPLFLLIGLFCFFAIICLIWLLYPEQEFAFGNKRYKRRLKLRKALGWILATIIIPIILSFFF